MEPTFYASIAEFYDHIFPYNALQVKFVQQNIGSAQANKVLEVGCGTGSLSFGLASVFKQVVGIDLDEEMLHHAQLKNTSDSVHFTKLNMLHLKSEFSPSSFNSLVCFGNTLVHLQSLNEIDQFFASAHYVLNKGGRIFLQIINYDRVLTNNVTALDTIDNDTISFDRRYTYLDSEHKIDFKTCLTIKKHNKVVENSQILFPISMLELKRIMEEYFSEVSFYGNFKGEEYTIDSVPLIVTATK